MKNEKILIEELRKRAKDNKADNGRYYLNLSFDLLNNFRNLLIAIATIELAYIQSTFIVVDNKEKVFYWIVVSLICGVLNLIFSWRGSLQQANLYSHLEQIYVTAFPSVEQYESMLDEEQRYKENFRNIWWSVSFWFLILQIISVFYSLFKIL